MKRKWFTTSFVLFLFAALPLRAYAAELLIPGGQIIGLELRDDTVTVAAFDDALGAAAREAGIEVGDTIVMIDETAIHCVEDVKAALGQCDEDIDITLLRGSKREKIRMCPRETEHGRKLGVYLRQGIAGIGTVTFYDPETHRFGTLGHGVNDSHGSLLKMTGGSAYEAKILSVKKGKSGAPGQLQGSAAGQTAAGSLLRNTPQGVFGTLEGDLRGEPLPVADYEDICTGPAVIRSTVEGSVVREYSVEILKIYPEDRSDGRNFLLKVIDPDLLKTTGGIVQGMSGSPIIQDGKLVGAVTHVLVNDPTTGYGIFIENMLDAAA